MKTLIGCVTMLLALCGCKPEESFTPEKNDTVTLTMEWTGAAADFINILLKEKGGIPEITANRKWGLHTQITYNSESQLQFPFNVQFSAVMLDVPGTTFGFVVTKTDRASPWAMTKAWKQSNSVTTDLALPSADVQSAANVELQRLRYGLRPPVNAHGLP